MHALVFADRNGDELHPLNSAYVPAMLPIAGKPVLEHTLEQLKRWQVTRVFLVVGPQAERIKDYFETGQRWSMEILYLRCSPGETPARLVHKLGQRLCAPFIGVRGDLFTEARKALCKEAHLITEISRKSLRALEWPQTQGTQRPPAHHLTSILDYYDTAMRANRNRSGAFDDNPLHLGIQARASAINLDFGVLSVGHYSKVATGARCRGSVVIGNHCVIDKGASLEDSIVLDNTWVGAGLELKHAIVMNDLILRVDLGASVPIKDAFLISAVKTPPQAHQTRPDERLAAALLGLLALVAGSLQYLWARLWGQPAQWVTRSMTGNRGQFRAPALILKGRLLCGIPRWFAVLRGDLRLFGRTGGPNTGPQDRELQQGMAVPGANGERPWHEVYQAIPAGAISLADLALADDASPTLRELFEIELQQQSPVYRCKTLARSGLRRIANGLQKWLPSPKPGAIR